jgi:hypothetical protein
LYHIRWGAAAWDLDISASDQLQGSYQQTWDSTGIGIHMLIALRVFRALKLMRYHSDVQVLMFALKSACRQILVPAFAMLVRPPRERSPSVAVRVAARSEGSVPRVVD